MTPFAAYAPPGPSPRPFEASFCELPTKDGSFVADGYPAYGRRIEIIAAATVESWK